MLIYVIQPTFYVTAAAGLGRIYIAIIVRTKRKEYSPNFDTYKCDRAPYPCKSRNRLYLVPPKMNTWVPSLLYKAVDVCHTLGPVGLLTIYISHMHTV